MFIRIMPEVAQTQPDPACPAGPEPEMLGCYTRPGKRQRPAPGRQSLFPGACPVDPADMFAGPALIRPPAIRRYGTGSHEVTDFRSLSSGYPRGLPAQLRGYRSPPENGGVLAAAARRLPSSIHAGIADSSAPAWRHSRAACLASGSSSSPSDVPSRTPVTSASRSARPPASSRSAATAAVSSSSVSCRHCARRRASPQISAMRIRSAPGRLSIMRSSITAGTMLHQSTSPAVWAPRPGPRSGTYGSYRLPEFVLGGAAQAVSAAQ
jgi:hypothetical protein